MGGAHRRGWNAELGVRFCRDACVRVDSRAESSAIPDQRRAHWRDYVESSEQLGRHRWIVESCLAWLQNDRRLVRRYERRPFHASADLGYRRLTKNNHLE